MFFLFWLGVFLIVTLYPRSVTVFFIFSCFWTFFLLTLIFCIILSLTPYPRLVNFIDFSICLSFFFFFFLLSWKIDFPCKKVFSLCVFDPFPILLSVEPEYSFIFYWTTKKRRSKCLVLGTSAQKNLSVIKSYTALIPFNVLSRTAY